MEEQDNKIIAQYFEKDGEVLQENGVSPKSVAQQGGGMIKSHYWKFVGGFFALLMIGFIGIPVVGQYVQKQEEQAQKEQDAASTQYITDLQERLKNDKDGGATAEETLKLFTEALRKGDIEQAGKYFVIEPKERQDALIGRLNEIKEGGEFENFLGYLEKVQYMPKSSSDGDNFFRHLNKGGMADLSIEITKDKYSTVWKIENLIF